MALVVLLALLGWSAPAAGAEPAGGGTPSPGTAEVWRTTPDRGAVLARAATVTAGAPAPVGTPTVRVDLADRRQTIDGFGASLTHASAAVIAAMPPTSRAALLHELFDPAGPVRLSVVRIPLGGSDFVPSAPYTFDDVPQGQTDWDLARFSTARDEEALRPVLRQILTINPDVLVLAAPWSAPAWLKTTGDLRAGALLDDPRAVPTYAHYLGRAVAEYGAAGIRVDYLTVQNEPQTQGWGDYPRMTLSAAAEAALISRLVPELRAAGLPTRVLGYDHNWEQDAQEPDHVQQLLAGPAAPLLAGTAFHCYRGDASAQEAVHLLAPEQRIWVTECTGTRAAGVTEAQAFADSVYWHSTRVVLPALDHWASAVLEWNLVLDASHGPHVGGCATCTGLVTVQDGTATWNGELAVLAHAARFLPRGSVRLGSTTDATGVEQLAFLTPAGEVVVLLHQSGWTTTAVTVDVQGTRYTVPVTPWSMTTARLTAPRC